MREFRTFQEYKINQGAEDDIRTLYEMVDGLVLTQNSSEIRKCIEFFREKIRKNEGN